MPKYKITFDESFVVEADNEESAENIGKEIRRSSDLEFQIEEVEEIE